MSQHLVYKSSKVGIGIIDSISFNQTLDCLRNTNLYGDCRGLAAILKMKGKRVVHCLAIITTLMTSVTMVNSVYLHDLNEMCLKNPFQLF